MGQKKKKLRPSITEVEIINRSTKKYRKIDLSEKEVVIYNNILNEFQLLSVISASYDGTGAPKDE
tara:strand:- start:1112 stop:1306 length:195 start_codon:yes stop_codon:yes gene_type:complete